MTATACWLIPVRYRKSASYTKCTPSTLRSDSFDMLQSSSTRVKAVGRSGSNKEEEAFLHCIYLEEPNLCFQLEYKVSRSRYRALVETERSMPAGMCKEWRRS